MSLGTTSGYVRAAKRSRICCYESPHAEAIGSLMRPFHIVSEDEFSEVASYLCTLPYACSGQVTAEIARLGDGLATLGE